MITRRQLKAARGLLDWSQTELGEHSGISQTAITNIEKGYVRPTSKTMVALRDACEREGVEFIEGGARLRPKNIFTFEGLEFSRQFSRYMYSIVQKHKLREVCLIGINEDHILDEDRQNIKENAGALFQAGLTQRFIVKETMSVPAENRINPPGSYRKLPPGCVLDLTPCFIFGTYYAMMLFDEQKVVVIDNKNLAEFHQNLFDYLWSQSTLLE